MPHVSKTYSAAEIAAEAGCDADRVRWLAEIGLLTSDETGRFTYGSVLAVKMVSALMDSGVAPETIEFAAAEGLLSFRRLDEYLPVRAGAAVGADVRRVPGRRRTGGRTPPRRLRGAGSTHAGSLDSIHVDEEAMFERYLHGMASSAGRRLAAPRRAADGAGDADGAAGVDGAPRRAARAARQGAIAAGELERFPDDVRVTFTQAISLAPEMFTWLAARVPRAPQCRPGSWKGSSGS